MGEDRGMFHVSCEGIFRKNHGRFRTREWVEHQTHGGLQLSIGNLPTTMTTDITGYSLANWVVVACCRKVQPQSPLGYDRYRKVSKSA